MENIFFYHNGLAKEKIENLILPENSSRVRLLEDILRENKESMPALADMCEPDEPVLLMTRYQSEIIEWVLNNKKVNALGLLTFASKQEFFNQDLYGEAIRIIYDLCNTGGKYTTPRSLVKRYKE